MSFVEEIKSELTLEAVLGHFGVDVPAWKSRPFNVRCFLPGHDDVHPSLTIYPKDNRIWCHGCRRGGDVIDISALLMRCDVKDAISYWSSKLNLSSSRPDPESAKRLRRERGLRALREACRRLSLLAERGMPRPRNPKLIEFWDYAYNVKDEIDEKIWKDGGPRTREEAKAYVASLQAWRGGWERFLRETSGREDE